ncbi:MAG: beta-N-acetylglucosaminidase domain-containing protein, partial [Phycisphaerales bacterium]|nr:beta-N-acetylglucosaminidase domain-containing protein [Phycisphaerales bacterium]
MWLLAALCCCGEPLDAPGDAGGVGDVGADGDATVSLLDEPIDLVPWARLRATGVRVDAFWPREAEDAIATIRDDAPDTAWRVPREGGSAFVDVAPWIGAPVRIDAVTARLVGDAEVTVRLRETCAGPILIEMPLAEAASNEPVEAACVELVVTPRGDVDVTAIEVLSRDPRVLEGTPATPPPGEIRYPHAGVVEGFYGVPWSWRERRDMVARLASFGAGAYVYAPKWDPLHRDEWRTGYPVGFLTSFAELAVYAEQIGVTVYFGLSPFVDYDPDADYPVLREKIATFVEAGVRGVVLLADDIEFDLGRPIDAALAQVHVEAVARLREDFPDVDLWFVPTVYSDERIESLSGEGYLSTLATMPADVAILWTGPATSNAELTVEDLARVTSLI